MGVDVNVRCVCNMHPLCPNELGIHWHHKAQHFKLDCEGVPCCLTQGPSVVPQGM